MPNAAQFSTLILLRLPRLVQSHLSADPRKLREGPAWTRTLHSVQENSTRWFKHLTTAHEDNGLIAICEEMGAQGYGVYWLILEHVARAMSKDCTEVPWVTHSEPAWRDICLLKSSRTLRKFIDRASELQLISCKTQAKLVQNSSRTQAERISITIPNLLKYRDEYSKKSGHAPDKLPAVDRETETEKRVKPTTASTTTEQAACGNVDNSRRKPVLPPEEYRAQHAPMNEAAFSKLLDSKDLNHFQNEIPKPSKPTPNAPNYLLSPEERAQPRNGSSKPREVIAIPVHPATELERMTTRLAEIPNDSQEWQDLSAEIVKKKASIEMKTKELEMKLR